MLEPLFAPPPWARRDELFQQAIEARLTALELREEYVRIRALIDGEPDVQDAHERS
jgi:hypothetical protein